MSPRTTITKAAQDRRSEEARQIRHSTQMEGSRSTNEARAYQDAYVRGEITIADLVSPPGCSRTTDRPWAVGGDQHRWHGYFDPSTGILRNLVGAQTWDELRRREDACVEARTFELGGWPVRQTLNLVHLQALHRRLFQDVYPWAGEIRTVDRGMRAGPELLPHVQVPKSMENFSGILRHVTVKHAIPALYTIVSTAHPFLTGNGRTQRQFFHDLSKGAGYTIDWTSIPQAVHDHASEAARDGDPRPMQAMFEEVMSETPERAAHNADRAVHPPW